MVYKDHFFDFNLKNSKSKTWSVVIQSYDLEGNFIIQSKIIEIYFNDNIIDTDNIYILDKNFKKEKLLFNLTIKKYPFLPFIPTKLPYLCYFNKDYNSYIINLNKIN